MAKVTYNKLNLKMEDKISTFEQNGNIIEVKQYLPIEQKMALIERVINNSINPEVGYCNNGLVERNFVLEIIFTYTNISFTEKQKEDLSKLYDTIVSTGFWNDIAACMDKNEFQWIRDILFITIDNVYKYRNSVYGIMDNVTKDYSNLNLEASDISSKLTNQENLGLLKNILDKLG